MLCSKDRSGVLIDNTPRLRDDEYYQIGEITFHPNTNNLPHAQSSL
jgi:hypothetical protein